MVGKKTAAQGGQAKSEAQLREERLKAALKSNMARRKAQMRARNASGQKDKDA
ncbi:MAG: hypothetical protein AAGA08_05780 [Pseudomonadota bacterium]